MLSIRQEKRPAMRLGAARMCKPGDGRGRTALFRYLIERSIKAGRKNNDPIAVPRTTTAERSVAKRLRGTTRNVNDLQLGVGEKTYAPAVRGPERDTGKVGGSKMLGRATRQGAYP